MVPSKPRLIFILALWHLTRELGAFWLRPARFAVISTFTCIGVGTPASPLPLHRPEASLWERGEIPSLVHERQSRGTQNWGAFNGALWLSGLLSTIEVGNGVCRPKRGLVPPSRSHHRIQKLNSITILPLGPRVKLPQKDTPRHEGADEI